MDGAIVLRAWAAVRRHWRLGIVAYGLSVVVSVPVAIAVGLAMQWYFGHRDVGVAMSAVVSVPAWVEFRAANPAAGVMVFAAVAAAGIGGLIAQAMLAGAVLGCCRQPETTTIRSALQRGGQHLTGLVGLSFLGTPFVLGVAYGAFTVADRLNTVFTEGTTSDVTLVVVRLVLMFVALIVVVWASGTHDLMRVCKVDGAGVFHAFIAGLWRGLRRPGHLLARSLPWLLAAWLLTLGISVLDAQVPWSSQGAFAAGVLLQQSLCLMRALLRVAGLAAVQGLVPLSLESQA